MLFAATQPALGQETTGSISGRVVDSQSLAVPGATVTVAGLQGRKQTVTDSAGNYTVPFLTPGTYTVTVELQGFKTAERKDIAVALGQKVDVPMTMQIGGLSETVQVVGAPAVVDTRSTTTGANITSEQLEKIPVGRNVSQVLYLSPGVSSSNSAGENNPSISGGSGLDNQYIIDGVNVTNQGYGAIGSYSIVFGSLGNATPFDFIQEVQVKTGGYQAEFGNATGGVVNVITKSGSNSVSGSVFGYSHPGGLESAWKQFQSINGSVQTVGSRNYDGGVAVGLPVKKDQLFFFGAINPARTIQTLHAPDGFPLDSLGDVDRVRNTLTYSAKGTWNANSAHRIDVSFFGDPSHGDNGPQRTSALLVTDTSSFSSLDYGGHNQTVRYNGIFANNWLVEGSFARAVNTVSEAPSVNQWRVTDQTVTPRVITGGIGQFEAENHSLNRQFSVKSTNLIGGHELKYGGEYDLVGWDQVNQRTGPTFTAADGRQTATGAQITVSPDVTFGQIYRVTRANFNSGRATDQHYVNFFVQDSWRIGERLTINPGLRYEQETMSGTIVKDFSLKNNWAPRIGATFDLAGDGRTKIYGNYGRYYARIPNDLAARALSADDVISRGDYFDAALTKPIPNGIVTTDPTTGLSVTNHFVLAGASPDTIDPNAKLSYINEAVIGVEREIAPKTSVGVHYIYRNIGRVLEDVANAPMVAYDLGVPGLSSVEYILTNPTSATPVLPSAAFLGASFDNPIHKYQAVEVTANRRFSNNWSLMGSYRWSRLRGNFEGFYRDDNGQSDPGITSLYDFPTNDPSYTAIGVPQFGYRGDIRYLGANGILPLDRPHQIKAFGNYTFPMGVNLGFGLDMSSGAPLTPLAANPNYASGGEIPEAPRGSGIQTIDGFKTRTPFVKRVDMQASYRLKLGADRSLTLLGDVFNLFDWRTTLMYDQWTQLTGPADNPDFGSPVTQVLLGSPPQFQAPRQVRLGARLSF
jgi:outer membrane receptor protein involved in Fe transport